MKHLILLAAVLVNLNVAAQFDKFFHDKTLRMDYYHSGNNENEAYYFYNFRFIAFCKC